MKLGTDIIIRAGMSDSMYKKERLQKVSLLRGQ
jgi:hypothetical protein